MKYAIGDKVNVEDGSYSFGVYSGRFSSSVPYGGNGELRKNLTVVETNLSAMRDATGDRTGEYFAVNDLLITDGKGNFWFTQSRFCEPVDKEIEIRYFSDGEDITDEISEETKRNLKSL